MIFFFLFCHVNKFAIFILDFIIFITIVNNVDSRYFFTSILILFKRYDIFRKFLGIEIGLNLISFEQCYNL